MAKSDFTFAFHSDEKTSDGFFRILKAVGDQAQALIESDQAGGEPVHEGRVLIKRTRALLWFARPALAHVLYERSKNELRKASGLLAKQRDLRVTESTLEQIGEEVTPRDRTAIEETLAQLKQPPMPLAKEKGELDKAMRLLVRLIESIKVAKDAAWPSVAARVEKAYQTAQKAARKARKTKDDLDVHNWRKKAKRLFYELELSNGHAAGQTRHALKDADELQDRLGQHQDCVVVEKCLFDAPSLTAAALRVAEILRGRKKLLRKKSRKTARRLKVDL
jgi:CHAD domain-containing protein